jgi:uncharacterized protein (DUF433 family)
MSDAPTVASHIEITPGICAGKPRIAGHRIRVQDIVLWTEEGQSADEILAEFPQLSLSDVYAALAYYHDHREPIDKDIREDEEFFNVRTFPGLHLLDVGHPGAISTNIGPGL